MRKLLLLVGLLCSSFTATRADMSNGADDFYISDKVTMKKVSFENQYQMKGCRESLHSQESRAKCQEASDHCRTPDGGGERADR